MSSSEVTEVKVQPVTKPVKTTERTCCICYDDWKNPSVLTTCGHVYCNECITSWLKTKKTCPTCNKESSQTNVIRIYI
jgi:hypothetical protein